MTIKFLFVQCNVGELESLVNKSACDDCSSWRVEKGRAAFAMTMHSMEKLRPRLTDNLFNFKCVGIMLVSRHRNFEYDRSGKNIEVRGETRTPDIHGKTSLEGNFHSTEQAIH